MGTFRQPKSLHADDQSHNLVAKINCLNLTLWHNSHHSVFIIIFLHRNLIFCLTRKQNRRLETEEKSSGFRSRQGCLMLNILNLENDIRSIKKVDWDSLAKIKTENSDDQVDAELVTSSKCSYLCRPTTPPRIAHLRAY